MRALILVIAAAGSLSACATVSSTNPLAIPVAERAQALTAVINMRRQLFRDTPSANACDIYRLLDNAPNFREMIREDARTRIGPGDGRACAETSDGWRIVSIRRRGDGLEVRVSARTAADGHYEDYLTREWIVSEVRVHSFVYD